MQLDINENLMAEALEISGFEDHNAVLIAALEEFIMQQKHLQACELFGRVDYDPQRQFEVTENNFYNDII